MFCTQCGVKIDGHASFCTECGASLKSNDYPVSPRPASAAQRQKTTESKSGGKWLWFLLASVAIFGAVQLFSHIAKGRLRTNLRTQFESSINRTARAAARDWRENRDGIANAGTGLDANVVLHCSPSVEMKFALIPSGTFQMSSPESEADRDDDEGQHTVTISEPFYMGIHEVTQAQYEAVMGTNPSSFTGDNLPVECVSWEDAMEFCRKLSEKTGRRVRLPTEAEWEYACRAGTMTPFSFGETISTEQVNYDGNYTYGNGRKGEYRRKPTPVGTFPANPWGLYEMHGNVDEWCSDWYGAYPTSAVTDPKGASTGISRVVRGGSWGDYPWDCRSAYRSDLGPSGRLTIVGFRVSLD